MLAKQGGPAAGEIAALGGAAGIGPLRNQILQVLESRREEENPANLMMVPKDVHDELVGRGNRSVTLDNVRVTMKRMADSNELLHGAE